ncbi:glycosyltransferase [Pelovirga terrestris]|uniref:Glycosyltransferase n=1 Tax=Pelovirga terrestris TaxID=2771352 RepID=A0A8J6R6E6_9BACT|nr:glycosyltransferase [Pelovirga terrestris]MBD1401319.1 glycosyltransferase [Pelovirga terrestris]
MKLKIAFICQPEYFRFSYENDLDSFACVKEFPFHFDMSASEFTALEEFDADYNFFFRGEFFPDKVLCRLRGNKVNFSSEPFPRCIDGRLVYTRDSLSRYNHFRHIRHKPFDYVFHYDESSLAFMAQDGIKLSGAFPFPVATRTYAPRTAEKNWDLFFIGRSSTHREQFFGPLKHRYHFLHIAHGIWGPPLVEYLCQTKICLNIHAEDEVSWEPRMQMLLAVGVFVISEQITPNSVLRPNIDYVEISTPQQLSEAVEYYLAHPEERQRIAASGRARVCEHLDARAVYPRLVEQLSQGQLPRFAADPVTALREWLHTVRRAMQLLKALLRP